MNDSEKFVADLCNHTFLSFWSFPNPVGKKGKELCDLLVICDPYVLIFSVKHIIIKDSGDYEVDVNRWLDRAVEESRRQIFGAERFIQQSDEILLKDKKTYVKLPLESDRKIFRIAVAIGRGDKFPLIYFEEERGFIHVFDERSIGIILKELDTISDFIEYLGKIEPVIMNMQIPFLFGEEDLLAFYLVNGKTFPEKNVGIILDDSLWNGLSNNQEYIKEKQLDKNSYVWDKLIEEIYDDHINNRLLNENTREELEIALRIMAKENRYSRRILSESFLEFIGVNTKPESPARIAKSPNQDDVVYVFLLESQKHKTRKLRQGELALRCIVARSIFFDCQSVIGIATEKFDPEKGYSLDIFYLNLPNLDEAFLKDADGIKQELGYFKNFKDDNL
jgi:hypothetical protein